MDVIAKIVSQAQANIQRIVLPEGGDNRTLIAADKLVADKVADIILMGNESEIAAKAAELGLKNISGATIIDPVTNPKKEEYATYL